MLIGWCCISRVPVVFQSDRVNLVANPKWQKNAKNNNLQIVWADSVLKINRKDGKVQGSLINVQPANESLV